MINTNTAKRAVNTILAYCQQYDRCEPCSIVRSCREASPKSIAAFSTLKPYKGLGIFKNDIPRPPKFDITLKHSPAFRDYINKIFMEEAEKAGLPMSMSSSIKWFPNGAIKVTFVDDNRTRYVGVARCHPRDAFNPEIGIKLAIERAAQMMHEPFIPGYDEAYFYVDNDDIKVGVNHHENRDAFNISLGNCFKTFEQADAHKDAITKRMERAIELLRKCRDDNAEDS